MGIFETWDFGEGYHKVHIRNEEAYTKIKSFLPTKHVETLPKLQQNILFLALYL